MYLYSGSMVGGNKNAKMLSHSQYWAINTGVRHTSALNKVISAKDTSKKLSPCVCVCVGGCMCVCVCDNFNASEHRWSEQLPKQQNRGKVEGERNKNVTSVILWSFKRARMICAVRKNKYSTPLSLSPITRYTSSWNISCAHFMAVLLRVALQKGH